MLCVLLLRWTCHDTLLPDRMQHLLEVAQHEMYNGMQQDFCNDFQWPIRPFADAALQEEHASVQSAAQ